MAPPEMERASTTGAAAKGRTPQVRYVYRSLLTIGIQSALANRNGAGWAPAEVGPGARASNERWRRDAGTCRAFTGGPLAGLPLHPPLVPL